MAEGWDTQVSHAWFTDGRLQARTEALIVAAQGVVQTHGYQARVLREDISPVRRVCRTKLRW